GFTHSFVGLALLAAVLTLVLWFTDRRLRSRDSSPAEERSPCKPFRLFWLCYLGGLGHTFFDYTNSYGVRPFLPFSNRWYYGDLIFVVDPWILLILGASAVWLTATNAKRIVLWLAVGVLPSLLIVLVRESVAQPGLLIPATVRLLWFLGLALIVAGSVLRWSRAGPVLAQASLLLLVAYYAGMTVARQSAVRQARSAAAGTVNSAVAWPAPADPSTWQAVITSPQGVQTGWIRLSDDSRPQWTEVTGLQPGLVAALRSNDRSRTFLDFARFFDARVLENESGYAIQARDLRFTLRMNALVDREDVVKSVDIRWY
ncbi:MAG TPA: metal-dependent hydrolase, partial [Blastocatellia bacterium]|nr:metal-dependent hydrolase [Blastocatellia bacterium]